ncbi:MAG: ATP-binding protein [Planctomycetota bacterium]|nr:ATP-binding protein [Planctomycetota bacterium]
MAKGKHSGHAAPSPPPGAGPLWLLAELAEELGTLDDPVSLQQEVLERALTIFHCRSGAFCPMDAETGRIRLGPISGSVMNLRPEEILAAEPVRVAVIEQRRPLVMADASVLSSGPAGWRGMAVIPLMGSEGLEALLVIGDLAEDHQFGDSDTALMAVLGRMAASALGMRLAIREFRREVGQRMTDMVAQLNRTAAELERVKTFADDFFESVPFGIILFDREFRVTFHNHAADRLWPEDRSVLAAARRTSIAQSDPDWEQGLKDVVNMQRAWLAEAVAVERPNQEAVRVNLWCAPLVSEQQSLVGGVLIVEDVSQRVQMERRLAVSERLAGVGRLAAMVAHEINNPLDGIIRLVNLSRRTGAGSCDPKVDEYLAEAHKGLMRLVTIVRDLLDFSRSASGAVDPMPLRETLTEAARAMAQVAERAGVRVSIDCAADLPPLRSATLYHVVLNLIKNAIEAMPGGGLIEVAAHRLTDAVVVSVADSGPGIPPDVLAHLFEPFFSLKATGKGTGLGLVICKDLIEKQGGSITAANRPEGGAVFTVRIPVTRAGRA